MVHVSNFLAFHYNFAANGPNYPRGNGEGHIPCDFTMTKGSNVREVIKFTPLPMIGGWNLGEVFGYSNLFK